MARHVPFFQIEIRVPLSLWQQDRPGHQGTEKQQEESKTPLLITGTVRPPVLGLLPKVVPPGGDTLGGQWVPGGTNICSNTGALLRSRPLFGPDADVFRPERFTDLGEGDSPRRRDMERCVEFAFGSGQWQCVGRRIAFMKLSKTVFEVRYLVSLSGHATAVTLTAHVVSNFGKCRPGAGVSLGLIRSFFIRCSGTSTSS